MNSKEANSHNLTHKMLKEKTETKRYTNSNKKYRSHSLPHFHQFRKLTPKPSANPVAPKNIFVASPSSRCLSIIEQLINYVSNSKSFTANTKSQISNHLKNLEQICKRYIKKSIKQTTASQDFWTQWYQMKNLMLNDLSDQLPKLYSRCQVFIDSLRTTIQKRCDFTQIEIDKQNQEPKLPEEEINKYSELLQRVNDIQDTSQSPIDQIKGFKAIKEEMTIQSQSDKTILNVLTQAIQALSKYRETDNNNNYLTQQLTSYEEELQSIFTPIEHREDAVVENIVELPTQKSMNQIPQQLSTNNLSKRKITEPALTPQQKDEYNQLFAENRKLKASLKRSLDNKRILERKKKDLDNQIKNEIEEKQKTIKNLQRKKQISETALQELKTLNEEITQQKAQLAELQRQVLPLREDIKSLNDESMNELEKQIQTILGENEQLKQDISSTKKKIRITNEILNAKYSIGQGPPLLLPRFAGKIYDKSQEISMMNSSNKLAAKNSFNQIEDKELFQSQYQSLLKDRNELIDQISNEKAKMKMQMNEKEASFQNKINELMDILRQIEEKDNSDVYNTNEKEAVSIITKTQENLGSLRQNARIELLNQQANSRPIIENELENELQLFKNEIKSLLTLHTNVSQQISEYQGQIIRPKIEMIMNRNIEKLLKMRSETDDDLNKEMDKINEDIEINNNRMYQILSKAHKFINELSSRMMGTDQNDEIQYDPVLILQKLAISLNQNDLSVDM